MKTYEIDKKGRVLLPKVFPIRNIGDIENNLSKYVAKNNFTPKNKKIAVIVHLYYLDLWFELSTYLNNISKEFDLFVTIVEDTINSKQKISEIEKSIKLKYPKSYIFIVKNKGLDIGGFLLVIDFIIKNNLFYDFIIKIHGKRSLHTSTKERGESWRKELLNSVLGSEKIFSSILKLMSYYPNVGMVGSKLWNIKSKDKRMALGLNEKIIFDLVENKFNLDSNIINKNKEFNFIAGTIFWCRFDIIVNNIKKINITDFYSGMEDGACSDAKNGTITHSMERLLALFMISNNKVILPI